MLLLQVVHLEQAVVDMVSEKPLKCLCILPHVLCMELKLRKD